MVCTKTQQKLCTDESCNICLSRSFESHPKSKFWSQDNELKPREVLKGSKQKFIFNCNKCNHNFIKILSALTCGGKWCPYCANQKLCNDDDCETCLNKSFASHPKSEFWSDVNEKTAREVFMNSGKKAWFNCNCGHKFEKRISNISRENSTWCPYCANKILCDNNNCVTCLNKSFESHPKSKFWSSNNELNPRQVFKCSGKKFIFYCKACNHNFTKSLASLSNGRWCPYCANQKLCDNDDCETCLSKSFKSHPKSEFWNSNNKLKPQQVFKNSGKKFLFDCNYCGHIFEESLQHISRKYKPVWCSYCANRKLCDDHDCKTCLNKSFESHPKSEFWSKSNKITPRQVFKSSKFKYLFNCINGHTFSASTGHVTRNIRPTWCPYCINKTESILYNYLKKIYETVERQFSPSWSKNPVTEALLPFDFVIHSLKIIIELDGEQHFVQVSNWNSPQEITERDVFKMSKAIMNGYSVVRILQKDVWDNNNNWEEKLCQVIQKYDKPQCIFITQGDEYKLHKDMLSI